MPWSFCKLQACEATIVGSASPRPSVVALAVKMEYILDYFALKLFSFIPFAFTSPFVLFTKFLHCSLSMHITFASFKVYRSCISRLFDSV